MWGYVTDRVRGVSRVKSAGRNPDSWNAARFNSATLHHFVTNLTLSLDLKSWYQTIMSKFKNGWIVAAFFMGIVAGQCFGGQARADGSLDNPLNRIDQKLGAIVSELHGIREKMK